MLHSSGLPLLAAPITAAAAAAAAAARGDFGGCVDAPSCYREAELVEGNTTLPLFVAGGLLHVRQQRALLQPQVHPFSAANAGGARPFGPFPPGPG